MNKNTPSVPISPPQSLTGTPLSSTDLQLDWYPPNTDTINGVLQYYAIYAIDIETGFIYEVNTTLTTYVLSSLHPYYTYVCSVHAVTVGEGPEARITVQMPEDGMNIYIYIYCGHMVITNLIIFCSSFSCSWECCG